MTTDCIMREVSEKPTEFDRQNTYALPAAQRSYKEQYNNLYAQRSKTLKSRVMKMAAPKWKDETINGMKTRYINKLLNVKNMEPCFIIGTVFVDMKYKPNILKEVSSNVYGAPEFEDDSKYSALDKLRLHSYSDPKSDQVVLEDDSGRLVLDGELLDKVVLVTGVIVGVLGMVVEDGIFTVVDITYPEAAPQLPRSVDSPDQNILYVSGLRINASRSSAPLEILKEFIMGELTDLDNVVELLQKTTELVILGNSTETDNRSNADQSEKAKYQEVVKSNFDAESLAILDDLISDLLVSIPVSILPGEMDPSEIQYPKEALHKSLFTRSSRMQNFTRLTNPAWMQVNGTRVLATSGENVNDMFKYVIPNIASDSGTESPLRKEILHESRLKLLESNILWQNIAPTAPDTLSCYPFENGDPFSLTETPHLYVVGNQPKFETTVLSLPQKHGEAISVRIVSVPDFSQTGQCVFVNTQSLECVSYRIR